MGWFAQEGLTRIFAPCSNAKGIRFCARAVTVRLADGKVQALADEERMAVTRPRTRHRWRKRQTQAPRERGRTLRVARFDAVVTLKRAPLG